MAVQGMTLLHRLAATGQVEAVGAFLQAAGSLVELGKLDPAGHTASGVASMRGHFAVAHLLAAHQVGLVRRVAGWQPAVCRS